MMMNLFSVFDPVVWGVSFNWVSLMSLFIFVYMFYYLEGSLVAMTVKTVYMGICEGLSGVVYPNYSGLVILGFGVFVYLALNNYLGLFPFIYTATAHPFITLGVGLVYWLSCFLMGWIKSFSMSIAHLVPEGSPLLMSPALVMIESISHLMRPFTLSVRLAANMMAGHLIMGLLSSISLVGLFSFSMSVLMQLILLLLEWGVALIQGLVFSILLLLYAVEYY